MSFFEPSSGAPDVIVSQTVTPERFLQLPGIAVYRRNVTVTEREIRGVTKAAADSAAAALATDSVTTEKIPIGAGGWNVRYITTTETSWAIDT